MPVMRNKKNDFRTSSYFPETIRFVSILLIPAGLLFIFVNLIAGAIFLISAVVVLTTHYRLEVDLENKVYRDYVWFLGLKNGKTSRYENIEYLFIKKSKVSQNLNSRISTKTITKNMFDGYLKFNEAEKIHLLTKENKTVLITRLKTMAEGLQVKIVDYSADEPMVLS
jgi:hypothetical protein